MVNALSILYVKQLSSKMSNHNSDKTYDLLH